MKSDLKKLRAVIADDRELNEEEEKLYHAMLAEWRGDVNLDEKQKGIYPYLHIDP